MTDYAEQEERLRCKEIARHVWNYLGLNDPGEVAEWLREAIGDLRKVRPRGHPTPPPWDVPPWTPTEDEGSE